MKSVINGIKSKFRCNFSTNNLIKTNGEIWKNLIQQSWWCNQHCHQNKLSITHHHHPFCSPWTKQPVHHTFAPLLIYDCDPVCVCGSGSGINNPFSARRPRLFSFSRLVKTKSDIITTAMATHPSNGNKEVVFSFVVVAWWDRLDKIKSGEMVIIVVVWWWNICTEWERWWDKSVCSGLKDHFVWESYFEWSGPKDHNQ